MKSSRAVTGYLMMKNLVIGTMLIIIGLITCYIQRDKLELPVAVYISVIGIILSFSILKALYNVKRWRYSYNKEVITYTKGFFKIKTVVIPIRRIQQVETVRNIVLQKLGLITVGVTTTTKTHMLLPIPKEEAEQLVDFFVLEINEAVEGRGI